MAVTRLEAAREEARVAVAELDPIDAARLNRGLALDFSEHGQYQNAQARAFASGRISQDVATFLYVALGEVGSDANGGWAADTSLADKVVATQALAQLIQGEIALARAGMGR